MSAADQLLDDLKAIAIDLAAIDRMTVELAVQEIVNLRKRVDDLKHEAELAEHSGGYGI